MSDWISVEDCTPTEIDWDGESSINVLVHLESGQTIIGFFATYERCWCDDLGDALDQEDPVTHWMKIPEPPK